MDKNLKKSTCRLCQSESLVIYHVVNKSFTLYKCKECDLVQSLASSHNQLDDKANQDSINQDNFRKTSKEDMRINRGANLPNAMQKLAHTIKQDTIRINSFFKKIIDSNKNYKFIDLGSGYGHIGFNIGDNNQNVDVHLLETSKDRMEMGIQTFKPTKGKFIFHHKLLDSTFAKEYKKYFDISFSFHVLEHAYNPIDFIKNMYDITKSGGHIVLEVPNEDDDLQHLSQNYKNIIKFPAHTSYWNKKTLLFLLKKAGILNKIDFSFKPVQRYGFFNYIDWMRHDKKEMVLSDDYVPREKKSWIEKLWLKEKEKNFTTDSIMLIIKKN